MKQSMIRSLMIAFVLMIGFVFCQASTAKEKVYKWRAQTYAVAGSVGYKALEKSLADLKAATGGRIDIKLYGVGSLVGPFDQLDAVGMGIFECGFNAGAYYAGKDPAFAAFFQPLGLWDSTADVKAWAYHFGGNELIAELYAKYKVHYLGPAVVGAEPIMSNVPLKSLDDFKGIKIRTSGGLSSQLFSSLGASPVKMGGGDLYTGLDTNVVDAAEFVSLAENMDMGLGEVVKYVLYPSFHGPAAMCDFIINQKKWDALPDDLKAVFNIWIRQADANFDYMAQAESLKALDKLRAGGITLSTLPEEDMKKAKEISKNLVMEWGKKSELSGKIVNSIIDYLEKKGSI